MSILFNWRDTYCRKNENENEAYFLYSREMTFSIPGK